MEKKNLLINQFPKITHKIGEFLCKQKKNILIVFLLLNPTISALGQNSNFFKKMGEFYSIEQPSNNMIPLYIPFFLEKNLNEDLDKEYISSLVGRSLVDCLGDEYKEFMSYTSPLIKYSEEIISVDSNSIFQYQYPSDFEYGEFRVSIGAWSNIYKKDSLKYCIDKKICNEKQKEKYEKEKDEYLDNITNSFSYFVDNDGKIHVNFDSSSCHSDLYNVWYVDYVVYPEGRIDDDSEGFLYYFFSVPEEFVLYQGMLSKDSTRAMFFDLGKVSISVSIFSKQSDKSAVFAIGKYCNFVDFGRFLYPFTIKEGNSGNLANEDDNNLSNTIVWINNDSEMKIINNSLNSINYNIYKVNGNIIKYGYLKVGNSLDLKNLGLNIGSYILVVGDKKYNFFIN